MKTFMPVKVAMIVGGMPVNGISTVILNYCKNIDKNKFIVTILAGAPIDMVYREAFHNMGIAVKELPSKQKSSIQYYIALKKAINLEKYNIIHVHGNSAVIVLELLLARMAGIKIRIAHSHSTYCTHIKMHKWFTPLFHKMYTKGFSCSIPAGKWMFGNKEFIVIQNGVHTDRFKFDKDVRERVREKMKIQDKFVIGHVGKFVAAKNHPYLLNLFEKIASVNKDAYLLLIGSNANNQQVMDLISSHPYKDRINVYGETQQVEELYSVMDVFVLPSKYEGLSIALLEAQISGLPCIVSDVISKEVKLGESISFLSLDSDIETWKNAILNVKALNREAYFNINRKAIERFEIKNNVKELENEYLKLMKESVT